LSEVEKNELTGHLTVRRCGQANSLPSPLKS
jgi:hypothetical protein